MRILRFISMAGLAALLALPAVAQRAATTPVGPAKTDGPPQAGTAPSPVLEKRAPTAPEVEVLIDGVKHLVDDSLAGLVPVKHPDGSVSIDLQGRFQNVSIAKINADGSISTECVTSTKAARQFLTTPTPHAAPAPATRPTPTPAPKAPEIR